MCRIVWLCVNLVKFLIIDKGELGSCTTNCVYTNTKLTVAGFIPSRSFCSSADKVFSVCSTPSAEVGPLLLFSVRFYMLNRHRSSSVSRAIWSFWLAVQLANQCTRKALNRNATWPSGERFENNQDVIEVQTFSFILGDSTKNMKFTI